MSRTEGEMTGNNHIIRVLLVDDEEMIRRMLSNFLKRWNVELTVADNGQMGLELFEQKKPDLVITDVRMPNMDGLEMTRRILSINPDTLVVVITGYGSEDIAIKALRAGAANYLKKPFDLFELETILRKLMASLEQQQTLTFDSSMLEEMTFRLQVPNDLTVIPSVIQYVSRSTGRYFSRESWMPVRLGVDEILTNAIEHGNLGIDSEEKARAIRDGRYEQLIEERKKQLELAKRRVLFEGRMSSKGFECTITDQGEGFDWQNLPDPQDPENLFKETGRGILITRMNFDEVSFNDKGNQVRLLKKPSQKSD